MAINGQIITPDTIGQHTHSSSRYEVIAVAPFRPPAAGVWASGRQLGSRWALAALYLQVVATRFRDIGVDPVAR